MIALNGKCPYPNSQDDCIVISYIDNDIVKDGEQKNFYVSATSPTNQTIFGPFGLRMKKVYPYINLTNTQETKLINLNLDMSPLIQFNISNFDPVCADKYIKCSNEYFGDPVPGAPKACFSADQTTRCANEEDFCHGSSGSIIYFGAIASDGSLDTSRNYYQTSMNDYVINSLPNDQDNQLSNKQRDLAAKGIGRGWMHVRHTAKKPNNNGVLTWGPFTDQLIGTDDVGSQNDDSNHWTIKFDNITFDEFLFASSDLEKWMIMKKEDLFGLQGGDNYQQYPRKIQRSSDNPYFESWAEMNRRQAWPEDPAVSIIDVTHAGASGKLLYFGNEYDANTIVLEKHGGADVFIRNSTQDVQIVKEDSENLTLQVPSSTINSMSFDLVATSYCPTYEKKEQHDLSSFDIGEELSNYSVDQCKNECNAVRECLSFVFSQSETRCWLKSESSIKHQVPVIAISLDIYVKNITYHQTSVQIKLNTGQIISNETQSIYLNQSIVQDKTFSVGKQEIFSFNAFKCSNNCAISYQLSASNDSLSTACAYNQTNQIQGLKLHQPQPNDPFIIVIVDTSEIRDYEFYIWAFERHNCSVNTTSDAVTIKVVDLSDSSLSFISYPPMFTDGTPQGQIYEWSNQTEIFYTLPNITSDFGGENVSISMAGLNQSSVTFDHKTMQIRFFNFTESRNITIEIELKDLEDQKNLYQVKFQILVLETQEQASEDESIDENEKQGQSSGKSKSTFAGVVIGDLDKSFGDDRDQSKEVKQVQKRLTSTKVSSKGDFKLLFSENLKVPRKVIQLLEAQTKRSLEAAVSSNNDSCSDKPKVNPLDLYLQQAIEVRVLKYDEEQAKFIPDQVSFDIVFRNWTETELSFVFNFTDPLQISRNSKKDQSEIRILNERDFVSKKTNEVVYRQNQTIPLKVKIPKQLTFGYTEEEIVEQFQTAAKFGVGFAFLKFGSQVILKGSQKEMMPLFLSVQAISCITLYSTTLPAHTEIVLEEIKKLIEFKQLEPKSIYIMMKAIRQSKAQGIDYGIAYENQEQIFEEEDHFFEKLNFTVTFIVLGSAAIVTAGVLLSCKKSREYLKPLIQKKVKEFMWNGFILCIEIGYVGYCIMFVKIFKENESDSGLKTFKLIFLGLLIASVPVVSLIKLLRTPNEVLVSIKERKKTGELIDKLMLRKDCWKEKINFPIQQTLKATIVFCSLIKSTTVQLILVNLFIFIELLSVIQIRPYDLKKRERLLRISIRYFVQLCFLNLFLFVGRYIDEDVDPKDLVIPCGKDKPIIKMVFEGFVTDASIFHKIGSFQIALFVLLCLPSFSIMIFGCLRKSQLKKLRKQYLSFRIGIFAKQRYQKEFESCSKEKWQLIHLRIVTQNIKIQRYIRYLEKMLKLSQTVDPERQMDTFEKNHRQLQKIKYSTQLFVLKGHHMKIDDDVFSQKRLKLAARVSKLVDEQEILAKNLTFRLDDKYSEDFSQDFFQMTKYQIMDFIDQEIIQSKKPGQQQELSMSFSSSSGSSKSSESSDSSSLNSQQSQSLEKDLKVKPKDSSKESSKKKDVMEDQEVKPKEKVSSEKKEKENDLKLNPINTEISSEQNEQELPVNSQVKELEQIDSSQPNPNYIEAKTKPSSIKGSIMLRCQNLNKQQVKPLLKTIEEENGYQFTLSRPNISSKRSSNRSSRNDSAKFEGLLDEIEEMVEKGSLSPPSMRMKQIQIPGDQTMVQAVPTPISKVFDSQQPTLWDLKVKDPVMKEPSPFEKMQAKFDRRFEQNVINYKRELQQIYQGDKEEFQSYDKNMARLCGERQNEKIEAQINNLSNEIDDLLEIDSIVPNPSKVYSFKKY